MVILIFNCFFVFNYKFLVIDLNFKGICGFLYLEILLIVKGFNFFDMFNNDYVCNNNNLYVVCICCLNVNIFYIWKNRY